VSFRPSGSNGRTEEIQNFSRQEFEFSTLSVAFEVFIAGSRPKPPHEYLKAGDRVSYYAPPLPFSCMALTCG
jgi:hypothetical protein